jgi:hypothetical protein
LVEKFGGTDGLSGEPEHGYHVCYLQYPCELADIPRQRAKTAKILTEISHKMWIQDPSPPNELHSPLIIQGTDVIGDGDEVGSKFLDPSRDGSDAGINGSR